MFGKKTSVSKASTRGGTSNIGGGKFGLYDPVSNGPIGHVENYDYNYNLEIIKMGNTYD